MSIAISLLNNILSSSILALNLNGGIEFSLHISHGSENLSSNCFVSWLTFHALFSNEKSFSEDGCITRY